VANLAPPQGPVGPLLQKDPGWQQSLVAGGHTLIPDIENCGLAIARRLLIDIGGGSDELKGNPGLPTRIRIGAPWDKRMPETGFAFGKPLAKKCLPIFPSKARRF